MMRFGRKRNKNKDEASAETGLDETGTETATDQPAPADGGVDVGAGVKATDSDAKEETRKGWFSRLKAGLSRSTGAISDGVTGIFTKAKLDAETLEELEDLLIQADLGVDVAMEVTEALAKERMDKDITPVEVRRFLADYIAGILEPVAVPLDTGIGPSPFVVLVVGVNGTGKTTTIGKLGHVLQEQGRRVMLAAGDTFRAAAIEQLQIWGKRLETTVVSGKAGADAAGLAYDALQQAREQGADVLLIDTAGRLQNKAGLMDELRKINRVLAKLDETAPHAVLLVLDATTGQNAISQVEVFQEVANVSGLVMTKLDGTARGGILIAVARKFGLPIHAVGVGEGIGDLRAFDANEFAQALVGMEDG